MSWQVYVDQTLIGSGSVTSAAICGLDGSVWAKTGIDISAAEAKTLISSISGDPSGLYSTGIKIGGVKYTFLRCEAGRSIYGKKGSDSGCTVVKTGQSIIIAVYSGAGITPGACTKVVEQLADYLISSNY
ncbi:profilin-1A-like [Sycon ciliatum]|uniref:profilin-1A-like n=1 Tax=Sycon ciliatum TaxID=27933 RepID=UPI0031F64606